MNYEKDIIIDPDSLDLEWLDQPGLLMKYARNAADCRRTVELAKEKLDLLKADIDKDIRKNPDRYGLEKVTEGAIQNATLNEKDYQEANKGLLDAKYELDIAQAALNAINQRKDTLENLVKLHGMQYFAGPKVPRDLSKEWQERQKQQKVNSMIRTK